MQRLRRKLQRQRMPRAVDVRPAGLDRRRDHLRNVHRLDRELDLAARDARNVEQIVDELCLHTGIPIDCFESLIQNLLIALCFAKDAGPAKQRRQWCSQFMRKRCQKFVLNTVGCFGFGTRSFGAQQQMPARLFGTLQLTDIFREFLNV